MVNGVWINIEKRANKWIDRYAFRSYQFLIVFFFSSSQNVIHFLLLFSGDIWDDLSTQPESENTSKLCISDLLTNVATDANEGNRYVDIQITINKQTNKITFRSPKVGPRFLSFFSYEIALNYQSGFNFHFKLIYCVKLPKSV